MQLGLDASRLKDSPSKMYRASTHTLCILTPCLVAVFVASP